MPGIQGIIPSSAAGAGTGPTLAQVVDRLADELGVFQRVVTTAVAGGPDPSRVALAAELENDEAGAALAGSQAGIAPWLYVASGAQAGEQRKLVQAPESGYLGHLGAVVLSQPLPAPLQPNVALKLTSPLPVRRHLGMKGLVECVNEGLELVRVPARLQILGAASREYPLAEYEFLQSEADTTGLYDTADAASDLASLDYRIVADGAQATLVTARSYGTDEPFQLGVRLPAHRLIGAGGVWTYRPDGMTGLSDDTDQTAAPLRHGLVYGMVAALKTLRTAVQFRSDLDARSREAQVDALNAQLAVWMRAANWLALHAFPPPAQRPMRVVAS